MGCKWAMTTGQKQQVACTRCSQIRFGCFLWDLPREEYPINSGRYHPQPEIQWIIIYTLAPISLRSSICGQAGVYTVTRIAVANSFQCISGYTRVKIYLRALSNGGRHPMAQYPTIEHSWTDLREFSDRMSVTGSRLAILAVSERGSVLAIWDWKSAELLFVCQSVLRFCNG